MNIKHLYDKSANYCFAITLLLVLFSGFNARAQGTITVTGTVVDETGATVPGATVLEKGTSNAVSTDLDGKYVIKVASAKSELVFSFIGYDSVNQVVGNNTTMNINLKTAVSQLDEVVVIGYGTAKKSDLTGAVATISGGELKKLAMPSVAEALTGLSLIHI